MSEVGTLGVLLTHGVMADGLIDAVTRIAGADAAEAIVPLSNEGRSQEGICQALEEIAQGRPMIVFTDLPAGSCALAARTLCRDSPLRGFVCGVNLPMLLEFVFHKDDPLEELVTRLVEKGRASVMGTSHAEGPK